MNGTTLAVWWGGVLALSLLAQQPGFGLPLARDGRPAARIVVGPSASSVEQFAAAELRRYLRKISGAELPMAAGPPEGARILVGEQPGVRRSDLFGAGDDEESFVVQTRGNDTLLLLGNSPRATLYAVYAFLERLGVHFFAPRFVFYQNHAELVPACPSLRVPTLDIREKPASRYRGKDVGEGWSHTPANLSQMIDWMAKNRLNVLSYPCGNETSRDYWNATVDQIAPEMEKRGIVLQTGGHGYPAFLPPDKYRKEHPDWFVEGANVFDVTNGTALQTYIDNVIAFLKERPVIALFDAWPPDGAKWPEAAVKRFGSVANAQAHVTNRLSSAVRAVLPHVQIENISYVPATDPPSPAHRYDPATFIEFAPSGRSYRDTLWESNHPKNKVYNGLIKQWRAAGFQGDVAIYEYYRKYSWRSLPVVLPRLVAREIPHYRSQGAVGLRIYSEPADWITYELTHLLVARALWDARLDAGDYVTNYLRDRYGPTAAPPMQTYFDLVEAAGRLLFHQSSHGDFGQQDVLAPARDKYLDARNALKEARARAGGSTAAAFLCGRLDQNLQYALADADVYYYRHLGQEEESRQARRRLRALVEAHRLDGIILKNMYAMRRYDPDRVSDPEQRARIRPEMRAMYRKAW